MMRVDERALRVEIPRSVLRSVFDECDRHDREETGGRMVGHVASENGTLVVKARGVIEPGPNAKRTSSSFFQDGEYQTQVFRRLEAHDSNIEHLGNWHTHHVNGYPKLSSGDIATYRRVVNHHLHNIDFFYALLVTKRNERGIDLGRYSVRHYILFRGDDAVYEIDSRSVQITDEARIWPKGSRSRETAQPNSTKGKRTEHNKVRVLDNQIIKVMFPTLRSRMSKRSNRFFWTGKLPLVDGSEVQIRVLEIEDDGELSYYPRMSGVDSPVADLCNKPFQRASEAVRALEVELNRAKYEATPGGKTWKRWRF